MLNGWRWLAEGLPLAATNDSLLSPLHVFADLLIWGAYAVIPALVFYFALKRRNFHFSAVGWLCMVFLLLAGAVHLLDALIFHWSYALLVGVVAKWILVVVAWSTILALIPTVPKLLDHKSPEEVLEHITQRERAELELRESQAAYSSLLESLPLYVFRKDREGRFIAANQRFCDTTGHSLEYILNKTDRDLFPPEQAIKYQNDDRLVIQEGKTLEMVEEHVQSDGKKLYVQVLKAPVRNANRQIIGTQGMFWDVTERVSAEEAAKRSDARFRRLLQSSLIGVMVCQLDGQVVDANDAFLKIVGFTRDELQRGKLRWDVLTPPEHRANDLRALEMLKHADTVAPWEKEYFRKDGSRVPILIGVTLSTGSSTECVCFILDISERKEAERALHAAKEAADAANQAKSQFVANMSHEVRTPMNAIIGLTELVLKGSMSSKQRENLHLVQQAADSLLAIINDVLDFSKIEAGKQGLHLESFRLRNLVGDAVKTLALKAHEKSLEIAYHVPTTIADHLRGDSGKLRQVLVNLVGNAVKFTRAGEVIIRVAEVRRHIDTVWLKFSVSDTGIGIPPQKLQAVFEAFEQVDSTTTRQYGGTGLGLAIVKSIVELMGGEITVTSEEGKGSTFSFTIPLTLEPPPIVEELEPHALSGRQVLIVDDHPVNRQIFEEILRSWEMVPHSCESVAAARETLQASTAGPCPFELILSDVSMPHEDGISFANWLQGVPAERRPKLILLSSGYVIEDQRAAELAIDAVLTKPVKQSELLAVLLQVLAGEVAPLSSAHANHSTTPDAEPLRMLIAEDSLVNQRLIVGLLELHGHSLTVVGNGVAAVEQAIAGGYDVVLMDVQMPELDGLQATKRIREHEVVHGGHLPIVAMTAHALPEDRQRCLDAGMDDYVAKPLREAKLLDAITRATGKSAHGTMAATVPSVIPTPPEESSLESEATTITKPAEVNGSVVDWQKALQFCQDDENLLHVVVEAFLEECPTNIAAIHEALAAREAAKLHRAAHTIKGSMRYFGAESLFQIAYKLEQLGAAEQFEGVAEVLTELEQGLSHLQPTLQQFLAEGIKR